MKKLTKKEVIREVESLLEKHYSVINQKFKILYVDLSKNDFSFYNVIVVNLETHTLYSIRKERFNNGIYMNMMSANLSLTKLN